MSGQTSAKGLLERNAGGKTASSLDTFTPACRVLCAVVMTLAITLGRSAEALVPALPIVAVLIPFGDLRGLLRSLRRVNIGGALICVLLPLTSADGLSLALLILLKLNMIAVVFYRMIVSLGVGEIDGALARFGMPYKLRVLMLLTVRHIFLLSDRVAAASTAISQRGGKMPAGLLLRCHAYMVGTTLLHTADRAERTLHAIASRGGFAGFGSSRSVAWRPRDFLLCSLFLAAAVLITAIGMGCGI